MMLPERLRKLPYVVHTNRELGLMLRRAKPLAYFADIAGHEPECVVRYHRLFDRHVAAGRLIKRSDIERVAGAHRRRLLPDLSLTFHLRPACALQRRCVLGGQFDDAVARPIACRPDWVPGKCMHVRYAIRYAQANHCSFSNSLGLEAFA